MTGDVNEAGGADAGSAHGVHHYRVTCSWSGTTGVGYSSYDRSHVAAAPPALGAVHLSADPAFLGDPTRLNPESPLVMAAASCQLLSFLAVASRARIDVTAYHDDAEALMAEDDAPARITVIRLRPRITVRSPAKTPRVLDLVALAHRECYIANSLRSDISVEATIDILSAPS